MGLPFEILVRLVLVAVLVLCVDVMPTQVMLPVLAAMLGLLVIWRASQLLRKAEPHWSALQERADEAREAGDWAGAEASLRAALEQADRSAAPAGAVRRLLDELAAVCQRNRKPAATAGYLGRLVLMTGAAVGRDHPETAAVLVRWAEALRDNGAGADAEAACGQALRILESASPMDDDAVAEAKRLLEGIRGGPRE